MVFSHELRGGYELRRLTTRRPKFFAEERDKTLKRSMQWSVLAECPTTSWTIRLLNASALADRDAGGETELASVIQEVLSTSLLKTLSSGLSFFGLLSLAGRRKKRARAARAPVVWDLFTELPHWSPLQRSLWKAIRTRRPLPLSAVILQLEADKEHLTKAVSLLTAAQEIRLRSGDILPASHIFLEVDALLRRAAHILKLWVDEVSQDTMIAGLREWPVVQLLADLEVSDLAQLQAIGRHFATQQMVRFLPSPEAQRLDLLHLIIYCHCIVLDQHDVNVLLPATTKESGGKTQNPRQLEGRLEARQDRQGRITRANKEFPCGPL